ncbi:MAG TPA: HD domain-containing protein, partial [Desulfobacterales bacterium]|nr:HD domain-containing protein [Desulfobacterales bacterium]
MPAIDDIRVFAARCFSNARGSHDWDHTQRVYNLCMHIGGVEGADLEALEIAAYLHDVGRSYECESKGAVCHAERGAEIARNLLKEYPLSDERKANIIHCI